MNSVKSSILLAVIASASMTGCGGSDSANSPNAESEEVDKTFDDFVAEVILGAGDSARDCGLVSIGESKVEANTCAAEAFMDDQAFYVIYELQGIDSQVAGAITFDTQLLHYWGYDSNPSGGVPGSPGITFNTECGSPEFSGSVDSSHEDVFLCSE